MKILYLITTGDNGGAQRYVLDLASALSGSIACGENNKYLTTKAKEKNIQILHIPHLVRRISPINDIRAFWEIFSLIKSSDYDIVHCNSSKAGILGSAAGKIANKKVVYTAHGLTFPNSLSPFKRVVTIWIEKLASLFRDKIIFVSKINQQQWLGVNISPRNKTVVIYNGIDQINFFTEPKAQLELGLDPNKINIGSIARLDWVKGLDILINAYAKIRPEHINKSHLTIIGSGPEEKKLVYLINQLGLKDKVSILGAIPEAARFLKAFDIYIQPSRSEGFPYSILEAMQANLKIIATKVGGVSEQISEPPHSLSNPDSYQLSDKIERVINDINIHSQKPIPEQTIFTLKYCVSKTKDLYNSL